MLWALRATKVIPPILSALMTCKKNPELLLTTRCKNFEGGFQIIQEWDYGDNPGHIL